MFRSLRKKTEKGFAGGVAATLSIRVLGTAVALVVSVAMARMMGQDGYGAFAFWIGVVTLLGIPANFGLATTIVRFTAEYDRANQGTLLKGLLRWSNGLVAALSLIIVVLAGAVFHAKPELAPVSDAWAVWLALGIVPIAALAKLRASALRGLRRFIQSQLPELMIRPVVMLAFLGAWFLLVGKGLPVRVGLGLYLVASAVAFGVGTHWLLRSLPVAPNAPAETAGREWLRTVGVLSLTRGGRTALARIDIVMIGMLATAADAGDFRVATSIVGLMGLGLTTINAVSAPFFARLNVERKHARMSRLLKISMAASAGAALIAAAVLLPFGRPLIRFLYGEGFEGAYPILVVLVFGELVNALAGPVGSLLNMIGEERWNLVAVVVSLVLSVIANLMVIPTHGAIGAAVVTSSSLALMNLIIANRVWFWLMRPAEEA